jgi:hypothetical protein
MVRSSKLLAVGIPLRLVSPNIFGGGMAPPDLSRGWTCGPHQQPDAEENGCQSCHMLPLITAAVTSTIAAGIRRQSFIYQLTAEQCSLPSL